ncbi:FAD-dependent monooxygenase [Streptomyces albireticuli]|uniref:FAD-dependent monooxygenase n=1 Tax=Streptomyces albireticuli TaxID=1940 RepID=UPI001F276BA2|nr:FAD-dependent monooxygenase [Streptomyces albireticuli]
MRVRGSRVAVVGGSVAGCATALAAARAGAGEVVVYERAAGGLQDRGVGLAVHDDRYAELAAAGHLGPDVPWRRLTRRPWIVRDGGAPAGRAVGVLPFPFRSYNWGSLWRELRAGLPASVGYVQGAAVERVLPGPDGAALRFADGRTERFDLVVGADGYRSAVRAATRAATVPAYAGYLAWRGTLPVELLPGPHDAWPEHDAATVVFPGGHMIVYRIPGPGGRGTSANWVFYTAPPASVGPALRDATSLPAGTVTDELVSHHAAVVEERFPPYWQEVVRRTPRSGTYVQPIYDLAVPHYGEGRLVLAGDAAAVARPHSGSGAVKALQDAAVLERVLREEPDLDAAVRAYDAERSPTGRAVVGVGRRLGRAQVQATPDWAAMDQEAVDTWWRTAADGGRGFGGQALTGPRE